MFFCRLPRKITPVTCYLSKFYNVFEKADPSLVSIKIVTGHLGVIISLLVIRRGKYIFLFSRKSNFGESDVRF